MRSKCPLRELKDIDFPFFCEIHEDESQILGEVFGFELLLEFKNALHQRMNDKGIVLNHHTRLLIVGDYSSEVVARMDGLKRKIADGSKRSSMFQIECVDQS